MAVKVKEGIWGPQGWGGMPWRRPLVYHRPSQTAYLGRPETAHRDVAEEFGLKGVRNWESADQDHVTGYVNVDPSEPHPELGWYDHLLGVGPTPAEHLQVAQALGVSPDQHGPEWRLSAATYQNGGHEIRNYLGNSNVNFDTEPWQSGQMGKALLVDGKLHMWGTYDMRKDPHHDGIFDSLRGGYPPTDEERYQHYQDLEPSSCFRIGPGGDLWPEAQTPREKLEMAASLHPQLRAAPLEGWTLSSVQGFQNGGHAIHQPRPEGPLRTEEWREGDEGKAMWWDDQFHVWRTQEEGPHHAQVAAPLRLQNYGEAQDGWPGGPGPAQQYYVRPDGELVPFLNRSEYDARVPEPFRVGEGKAKPWNLSRTANEYSLTSMDDLPAEDGEDPMARWHRWRAHEDSAIKLHVGLGWTPGKVGKGVMVNGVPRVWNVSDTQGAPHHTAVLNALGLADDPSARTDMEFGLEPSGEVNPLWWRGDHDEQLHKLLEADPRLSERRSWTAAVEHNLRWRPGTMGKGFADDDGRLHTFTTSGGRFAWYSHADLANAMGVDIHPNSAVFISPGGVVDGPADARQRFVEADPNLTTVEPDWGRLGSLGEDHQLNWDPTLGVPGKGLVDQEGNVHTWNVDGKDQHPWHGEYAEQNSVGRDGIRSWFYIDSAGHLEQYSDEDIAPEDFALIPRVDPRLTTEDTGWGL